MSGPAVNYTDALAMLQAARDKAQGPEVSLHIFTRACASGATCPAANDAAPMNAPSANAILTCCAAHFSMLRCWHQSIGDAPSPFAPLPAHGLWRILPLQVASGMQQDGGMLRAAPGTRVSGDMAAAAAQAARPRVLPASLTAHGGMRGANSGAVVAKGGGAGAIDLTGDSDGEGAVGPVAASTAGPRLLPSSLLPGACHRRLCCFAKPMQ